ncbi:MAG: UDP-N-acetylglucosamine 2-epimerase (non-hydrolyzing) [Desulfovibrio sp.]|uniref:non-hydrolyzing UDP-N-acetylglucosamine 2-epimerase n=1 Tax=Desulfovibrio sp. TaxID=885 RepID=UPI0039E2C2F4
MHRILILIGTRPEAVKMAPVAMELRRRTNFDTLLCSTGQHKEMLSQALNDFGLNPDRDLALMKERQSLASLNAALLSSLDELYAEEQPDMVLAQGDTTTVMAAGLTAFYRHIPFGHVEAGLRSFNRLAPFPEEINRKIAGSLAELHFAPTNTSQSNLLAEGVPSKNIFVVGNTVIDALLWTRDLVKKENIPLPEPVIAALVKGKKMVLVTGHRRESYEAGFEEICRGILAVSERRQDVFFVYPVHLNPLVRGPVFSLLGGKDNILLLDPLSYRPFVALMQAAHVVLTDSGGIQEEAPALGKPVLVMRETTERPEGVEAGNAVLVGTQATTIAAHLDRLLDDEDMYVSMSQARNPYGDGQSARRIVDILEKHLRRTA